MEIRRIIDLGTAKLYDGLPTLTQQEIRRVITKIVLLSMQEFSAAAKEGRVIEINLEERDLYGIKLED